MSDLLNRVMYLNKLDIPINDELAKQAIEGGCFDILSLDVPRTFNFSDYAIKLNKPSC